jgi:hypothetical protein
LSKGPPPPSSCRSARAPSVGGAKRARDPLLGPGPVGGVLREHLDRLSAVPVHGNRTLGYAPLVHGLLLAFFDPLARSLRRIEDNRDFGGRLVDLPRLARSTTSDALAALDPSHLRPLLDDLRKRVPSLRDQDPALATILRRIIAADGTYLNTLADVAWALHHTKRDGKRQGQVRLNVQLDVGSWAPQVITVSGDDGESEPAAFAKDLLEGVLYVIDRNFVEFAFLRAVLGKGNDFVVRAKGNQPAYRVLSELPPSDDDREAGVAADRLVTLTGRDAPPGTFRLVTIDTTNRKGEPERIHLLTSLTDAAAVPARVVGTVYKRRWQIELFFKWLKTWARMDHLLSTSRGGITFQFYAAMTAVLLTYVQTGRQVSVYALAAMARVARGQCTLGEAIAVIAHREREREQGRARQARRRAAAAGQKKQA